MSQTNRREFLVGASVTMGSCLLCPHSLLAAATAPVDIGPAADFAKQGLSEKWTSQGFFVVRSGNRLYALITECSHKRYELGVQAGQIKCPKHGSIFDLAGKPTKGPASRALARPAIQRDANGHIVVDPTRRFQEKQWNDPASFVAL